MLRKNPLDCVNSSFSKKLQQFMKDHDYFLKKFTTTSSSLPYMYGSIKTHKPENPVRPMTSSDGSISYKFSKWLVTVFIYVDGTISNSSVRNNIDLFHKLNNVHIHYDFQLARFNITALLPQDPVSNFHVFLDDVLRNKELRLAVSTINELT